MMKAALIRSFGDADVIEIGEVPVPKARPGRVLVRVSAVGLNYYDILIRSGIVSREIALPHVGGSDVAGVIEAVGEQVSGWKAGDRVIVAPGYPTDAAELDYEPENEAASYFPAGTFEWGGCAEFMEVDQRWLLADDTGVAPEELASMPLVLVTAVHAVSTLGGVKNGDRVLVQAGASGSGSMAIQVAKALGASVIATVSNEEKARIAREAGADEVIHYTRADVADSARSWTGGEGVDLVVDPVGGTSLEGSINSLRPRGLIVNFGLVGGVSATIPNLYRFFRNELRLAGSWMGSMDELRFGLKLVRQGKVRPLVDRVLPLESAVEAHRLIERHAVAGKIVLQP